MKHRFKHLLTDTEVVEAPVGIDLINATFDTVKEDKELSFGGGFDDIDNNDDDGDDDDDDDDDDEAYLRDKLDVAEDEASVISEARVIFQKDPSTGKTVMICRVDEMEVPEEYLDGKTMFTADVIFRAFREYSSPKKKVGQLDSAIFKKKNWKKRD